MKTASIFAISILTTPCAAHAYTNAEDAARGYAICKTYANETATLWEVRQQKGWRLRPMAEQNRTYTRPITAKQDEVLARDPTFYPTPADAALEVFAYCQDNLERLTREAQARGG